MGVDETSLDRIRNATFPSSRRGYDKHEVEKFLARLADWLETAPATSRARTRSSASWSGWGSARARSWPRPRRAQQIRSEAESLAREASEESSAQAEKSRKEAEAYSKKIHSEADSYAEKARSEADKDAADARSEADADARDTIADAQAQARRIVEEGVQRREDIEAVIADLVRRRDEVLDDTDELSAKLSDAVGDHRPPSDADPFDAPEELDPLAREGDEAEGVAEDEPFDTEAEGGLEAEQDLEAEAEQDLEAEEEPEPEPEKKEAALPQGHLLIPSTCMTEIRSALTRRLRADPSDTAARSPSRRSCRCASARSGCSTPIRCPRTACSPTGSTRAWVPTAS